MGPPSLVTAAWQQECDEGRRFPAIKRFNIAPRLARGLLAAKPQSAGIPDTAGVQLQPFRAKKAQPGLAITHVDAQGSRARGTYQARLGRWMCPRTWHVRLKLPFFFLLFFSSFQCNTFQPEALKTVDFPFIRVR